MPISVKSDALDEARNPSVGRSVPQKSEQASSIRTNSNHGIRVRPEYAAQSQQSVGTLARNVRKQTPVTEKR